MEKLKKNVLGYIWTPCLNITVTILGQVMGHLGLKAIQGSKLAKIKETLQYRSLSNTTELYNHTQPSPGWPGIHQGPKPSYSSITTVLEKRQLAKADHFTLATVAVKFDSHCEKKRDIRWYFQWLIECKKA